jgi:hypothetical protein
VIAGKKKFKEFGLVGGDFELVGDNELEDVVFVVLVPVVGRSLVGGGDFGKEIVEGRFAGVGGVASE